MSKAWHCDGPGCDTWLKTGMYQWIRVKYNLDFCSQKCLADYMTTQAAKERFAP